jgi:hypothetical protein
VSHAPDGQDHAYEHAVLDQLDALRAEVARLRDLIRFALLDAEHVVHGTRGGEHGPLVRDDAQSVVRLLREALGDERGSG